MWFSSEFGEIVGRLPMQPFGQDGSGLFCHWEDLEGTEPDWAEAENNNGWGRVQCMQSTF